MAKTDNNNNNNKKIYRIVGFTLSQKGASAGRTKRFLAIKHAIDRALAHPKTQYATELKKLIDDDDLSIEFCLTGTPDAPHRWEPTRLRQLSRETPRSILDDRQAVNEIKQELESIICYDLKPDMLLADGFFNWLSRVYEAPENEAGKGRSKRPERIYGLARYYKGAYKGIPSRAFDKLFQLEPFIPDFYNKGISRQFRRSHYEKENVTDPPEYKGGAWDNKKFKADRMMIAPVVDIDPSGFLSRQEARRALFGLTIIKGEYFDRYSVEQKELMIEHCPIIVCAGSPMSIESMLARERANDADNKPRATDEFWRWTWKQIKKTGYYPFPVGSVPASSSTPQELVNQCVIIPTGLAMWFELPELWRYLSGIDYLFGAAGYNLFYEVRLAAQLGVFKGEARFEAMHDREDQLWRAHHQERLQSVDDQIFPLGNGADYLADDILRKVAIKYGISI